VPPGRNIGHWSKTAGILPYTDRWSHSPERTLALNCAIHPPVIFRQKRYHHYQK